LLFTLSTWLMFRFAADLYGECAGLWSAILLNAAPVLGVTAGTWVLPDGPLIAALLGAALCLVRALPSQGRPAWGWWLGAGACFGIGLCSKYTAALAGAGVVLYLVTTPQARHWLTRPQPYAAALLAFTVFSPVIAWNVAHGWASLLFQGGRAVGGRWHPAGPLSTLGGEALFFLPWIWIPLAVCLWRAARRGPADPRAWLLMWLALPSVLMFELVSLRSHVLFHWAAPGTMMALPLLGDLVAQSGRGSRFVRLGLFGAAVILPLATILVGTEVRFNWLPDVAETFALGADPDIDAVDWTSLREGLAQRGELHDGVVVAAIRWHDAGKIDYALKGQVPVICLGDDPREYGIANPAAAHVGEDILIIAPRETLNTVSARFSTLFDGIERLPPILLLHAGRPAMLLPVFLAHRLHATAANGHAGPQAASP
jgi:Dolichyl-phosphate-mannose-protein mannosyltransferase